MTAVNPLLKGDVSLQSKDIVLKPPFNTYWADPFIVEHEDRMIVFFEEYLYNSSRGRINLVELFKDGTRSSPRVIIEEPFHLSFPNVFNYNGKYYLVPESSEANCIRLYESIGFPYEWKYCGNLIDGIDAVDTVFVEENGTWFMLTSEPGGGGGDNRGTVSIYYSDSPVSLGGWHAHPLNPVVNNYKNGRNGGAIIHYANQRIRPAQNSPRFYGESVALMAIDIINTNGYKESPYMTISPSDHQITNVHTINNANAFWCYDRVRISFKSIISVTYYRLLKLIRSQLSRN